MTNSLKVNRCACEAMRVRGEDAREMERKRGRTRYKYFPSSCPKVLNPSSSTSSSHPITLYLVEMPITGHCLCKAVTYKAEIDQPAATAYDHCDDCQRQSGSTYCASILLTEYFMRSPLPLTIQCSPRRHRPQGCIDHQRPGQEVLEQRKLWSGRPPSFLL